MSSLKQLSFETFFSVVDIYQSTKAQIQTLYSMKGLHLQQMININEICKIQKNTYGKYPLLINTLSNFTLKVGNLLMTQM